MRIFLKQPIYLPDFNGGDRLVIDRGIHKAILNGEYAQIPGSGLSVHKSIFNILPETMTPWISCYDRLPNHHQQVIFRTDHEGVFAGRYRQHFDHLTGASTVLGTFWAMTERRAVIGWNFRSNRAHSEVHEWMPLPE